MRRPVVQIAAAFIAAVVVVCAAAALGAFAWSLLSDFRFVVGDCTPGREGEWEFCKQSGLEWEASRRTTTMFVGLSIGFGAPALLGAVAAFVYIGRRRRA